MVVVFAVFCAGLRIEEVVACYELEYLFASSVSPPLPQARSGVVRSHTIAAILQTSVLAPHFAPNMTSGERYCLVWISFVKWWPVQHAFPKSAILTEMMSNAVASSAFFFSEELVLSRDMPETSRVRISLYNPPD